MPPQTTNFPEGLTSFGIPVVGSGNIPITNGNYWFVSQTGNDGNNGKSANASLATIQAAANMALSGDVILVLPGYTQSITAAGGIAIATAGVQIIGLGSGTNRPTISFTTATTAQMTITAKNVVFQNFIFAVGFDAVAAMIKVTANDVWFLNCDIVVANATMGVVLGFLTAATADRFIVANCRFHGPATTTGSTITACIQHEVGVDYQFTGNYFAGKMTQAILNATTNLRGLIDNNRMVIGTGTVAITMAAASTPFITNNRMNIASGTTPIVAAAGFVAGNIYSAAAGVTAGTASTF